MIESIRRIATTLFALGVLVVGITVIMNIAVSCPSGANCLGAVFSSHVFETEVIDGTTNSTLSYVEHGDSFTLSFLYHFMQRIGLYLFIGAAIVLIGLEMRESYYVQQFVSRRSDT